MASKSMEEEPVTPTGSESSTDDGRCPQCDSVVAEGSDRCIMCGAELTDPHPTADALPEPEPKKQSTQPTTALTSTPIDSTERKKKLRSRILWVMAILALITTLFLSILMLRSQGSQVILALQPTFTPLPPPPSPTHTWTPEATQTPPATETAVPSATPMPTDTPKPPRFHSVASGETMFGLSLLYRVSAASIAESNSVPLESPIQVGQQLNIPWPTATPPLESLVIEFGDDRIVADVTDCEIITIQEGDSTYGLSAQRGVPAEAIVAVNRLTEESIQLLHPGDTLCIPRIYPGDQLPATPGPQPTATSTAFPAGPSLLYPVNGAEIDPPDGLLRLQWVSVKDLKDDEWYMVELTNLDQLDSLPLRAFTKDTSFKVPGNWRPQIPELQQMRWRTSIVRVIGERTDGGFIYEYGGSSIEDSFFYWLGAVPTPTPTLTPTPTPEIE